jgi:hypothetical protein
LQNEPDDQDRAFSELALCLPRPRGKSEIALNIEAADSTDIPTAPSSGTIMTPTPKPHLFNHIYILDARKRPVHPQTLDQWVQAQHSSDFHVGLDQVGSREISTVFLGIAHSRFQTTDSGEIKVDERPNFFETAVITKGGRFKTLQRYRTWTEAEAGHRQWVENLRKKRT